MFWKKEKPKFEVRPLYSIREELELIKKFCWQPKLAAGKIYTEEEIDAVEGWLDLKLPLPLREPVPYSFVEQVEEKTGMLFWSRNGQGRERVDEKEKEMRAAGLFKR